MITSISAFAIVGLLIGAPSAYAQIIHSKHPQEGYQSGYDLGAADTSDPCNSDPRIECHGPAYVWKSPNGFINQTNDFIDGYVTGFCKIAGPHAMMDEPEADFWCKEGPKSAGWMVGHTIDGEGKFPYFPDYRS